MANSVRKNATRLQRPIVRAEILAEECAEAGQPIARHAQKASKGAARAQKMYESSNTYWTGSACTLATLTGTSVLAVITRPWRRLQRKRRRQWEEQMEGSMYVGHYKAKGTVRPTRLDTRRWVIGNENIARHRKA